MGGSSKKTTTTNQSQTQQSSLGSTPYATDLLPAYHRAMEGAFNTGAYTGDVVAAPTQQNQYGAVMGNVDRLIADPGAPLADYTPNVEMLDRYIAGATDTSREGLSSSIDWARNGGAQIGQTANDMSQFWGDVASGQYLDPNNSTIQNYLNAIRQNVGEDYTSAVNALRSEAIDSGAFGGTMHGTAATGIADKFSENLQNTEAGIMFNHYMQEMARRERATQGASDAYSLGALPGNMLLQLGELERGYDQLDIDDSIARNAERERGEALDIEDARLRRQDTALREQANLDNTRGLTEWQYAIDQGNIYNDNMRAQVDQAIRQAGLTNAATRHDAEQYGDMAVLERYFAGLANPVFGEKSSGTMQGTTTTKSSNPLWQDVLGAASSIAQTVGGFTGTGGGASGTNSLAKDVSHAAFQPLGLGVQNGVDYSRYFAPVGGAQSGNPAAPWYLQNYSPMTIPTINVGR